MDWQVLPELLLQVDLRPLVEKDCFDNSGQMQNNCSSLDRLVESQLSQSIEFSTTCTGRTFLKKLVWISSSLKRMDRAGHATV